MINCSKLVSDIMAVRTQASLLHYETHSEPQHRAFADFYSDFYDISDKLIELYIGKYQDVVIQPEDRLIALINYDELDINAWAIEIDTAILGYKADLSRDDGDLANVLDEMQGILSKLRYKLLLESKKQKHNRIFN